MPREPYGPLTARGKEIEAAAIVKRISSELSNLLPMLKRDRDADQIRGKIIAAQTILETVYSDFEGRL